MKLSGGVLQWWMGHFRRSFKHRGKPDAVNLCADHVSFVVEEKSIREIKIRVIAKKLVPEKEGGR